MNGDRGAVIALDAFGADRGPAVIVAGARAAAADGIGVRVFGPPSELSELEGAEEVRFLGTAIAAGG